MKVLAIICVAAWFVDALLAWRGLRAGAVATNVILAVFGLVVFGARPLWYLVNAEGYVRQLGTGAIQEIFGSSCLAAANLAAIVLSLLSLRRGALLFGLAWISAAPALLSLLYLAFWFRIF